MKYIILILTTLILVNITLNAQTRYIVKTPNGQNVTDSWIRAELYDAQDKIDISNQTALTYPLATEVNSPSATTTYNCHAYAWHLVEGGNPTVWIGFDPGITGEDIYWESGSYVEVASIDYADKVSYEGDHSAIKLSNTVCRSKWGASPLMEHPIGYGPAIYLMAQRKYYKLASPSISGTSYVCDNAQAIYSESKFSDIDLDYDWSVSSYIDELSGDGTNTFNVEGTSNIGSGVIYLTVSTVSGASSSTQKNIGVNMPYYSDVELELLTSGGAPVSYMCPNTHYHIYINNNSGCSLSNYDWSIPSGWSENYTWSNMISVYTGSSPGGMVEVDAATSCGVTTKVITDYFGSGYCGSSYSMNISPNPSVGETTISIEPNSEEAILKSANEEELLDLDTEWEMEIYSPAQILKKKETNIRGNRTQTNTSGWKEGVYMVRAKYKNEVLIGKLIVKK